MGGELPSSSGVWLSIPVQAFYLGPWVLEGSTMGSEWGAVHADFFWNDGPHFLWH